MYYFLLNKTGLWLMILDLWIQWTKTELIIHNDSILKMGSEENEKTKDHQPRMKRHSQGLPHFYPKIYLHPGYHDHGENHHEDEGFHGGHHMEHYPHMEHHEYDENGEHIEFGSGPVEHHDHHHGLHHEGMHMDEEHHDHSGHHPHHDYHEYHGMIGQHHHPIHHHEHSGHDSYHHYDDHSMQGEGEMGDMDVGGGYFQLEERGGDINIVSLKRTGTKVNMGGGQFNVIRDPWRQHSLFAGLFHPHERPPNIPIDQFHQHFTYISNDRQENHNIHEYVPITEHTTTTKEESKPEVKQIAYDRGLQEAKPRRHHHRRRARMLERLLRRLHRYGHLNGTLGVSQRYDDIPQSRSSDQADQEFASGVSGDQMPEKTEERQFHQDNVKFEPKRPFMYKALEIPLSPIFKRSAMTQNISSSVTTR